MVSFKTNKLWQHLLVGSAVAVAMLGVGSCSDEALDRENDQPSGLNSLYGYVSDNAEFSTFKQLIEDLGIQEELSRTGSMTLFVANDDAFDEFYKSNVFGAKSYAELTKTQKNILLKSAMISNPYTTSMLSTAQGPVTGEVCRRMSSLSLYDSVLVVHKADFDDVFPKNEKFDAIKDLDSVALFKDASVSAPLVHFTPKFITGNKLLSSDIDFLYQTELNGRVRESDDVYVNNARIVTPNIYCKNGFIHVVDKVLTPLDNMAETILKNPNYSIYSSILERFSAPIDSAKLTENYMVNKGAKESNGFKVYAKRYFSSRSFGSTDVNKVPLSADKDNNTFEAALKFDPGWNGYVSEVPSNRTALMEDMAVMLVPTNEAMKEWWDNGSGKVIKNYYASKAEQPGDIISELNATPLSVLQNLMNVNMLNSFTASLPSRFDAVLDDSNDTLGIHTSDVSGVTLACNGAIYETNKVFTPKAYRSVLFPAVVDTTNFKVIKRAIDNLEYDAYLNSMVSRYSFFIPNNQAMLTFVDPVSYGQDEPQVWEISLSTDSKVSDATSIIATVYKASIIDGQIVKGDKISTLTGQSSTGFSSAMGNRLMEILDNIIVIGELESGKQYYKTKGNNYVRVEGAINTQDMKVYGSLQDEISAPLHITSDAERGSIDIYDEENGGAYGVDGIVMGTRQSVCKRLSEHEEFSEFLQLLQNAGAVTKSNSADGWRAADETFGNLLAVVKDNKTNKSTNNYLLNAFHYTIYAPTNTAMEKAYEMGLPTPEQLNAAEELDNEEGGTYHQDSLKSVMLDFIKYHIQDNSIFVDEGFDDGKYESGKSMLVSSTDNAEEGTYTLIEGTDSIDYGGSHYKISEMLSNGSVDYFTGKYSPGRTYTIDVKSSSSGITVTTYSGQSINVSTDESLHNIYAREYWIASSKGAVVNTPSSALLDNSSCAVIHAVDTPLLFKYDASKKDDPDHNQFIYKDRELTSASMKALKNVSPRGK